MLKIVRGILTIKNRRRLRFFGWIIVAVIGIYLVSKVKDFLDIDRCLDHGGAWDYEFGYCVGVELGR